jgi:NadR type nicotinamide-nucleotide adenylyltransferase
MIRVSITGPESTGKSWLAENLARKYQTVWVPEYAREFLGKTGGHYSYKDVLSIAQGQLEFEKALENKAESILFSDTDSIVTRIWCEVKYGKVHPWILDAAENHRYDLYLLCNIDLPWQFDPLREHPEMRKQLFDRYLEVLKEMNLNYRIISGIGDERLLNAMAQVDEVLKKSLYS